VKIARMCRLNDVGLDIYCYQGAYGVLELNMKYGKEGFRQAGIDYYRLMDEMIQNGQI
ncbi:MAG: RimK family alpha-L-glutamate ligase, partial [Deltaproteobacteria bacterium]|nr:RimK family alpha-L-glutamate ligase [Deltaproteobacteria bacterium]